MGEYNRHLAYDAEDERNQGQSINKTFTNLPYDFAIRPSSPIYHLPPAAIVKPSSTHSIQPKNHKMIFKDSHVTSNEQPPADVSNNCQVRMKKVAC